MKKVIVLVVVMMVLCTACGSNSKGDGDSGGKDDSNSSASSKKYIEYFNKIKLGDSVEKVTEIIGFEGKETDKSDYSTSYFWDTGNENGVEVSFQKEDGKATKVKMRYDNKDLENDKVKIKDLEGLKAKVKKGMTYDEMKTYLGGVDGILDEKSDSTNHYYWRHPSGANVMASFSTSNDLCSFFTGIEK